MLRSGLAADLFLFFLSPPGLRSRLPLIVAANVPAGSAELLAGAAAASFWGRSCTYQSGRELLNGSCANLRFAASTQASVAAGAALLPRQSHNGVQNSSARWQERGSIKPHHVPSAARDADNSVYSLHAAADQTRLVLVWLFFTVEFCSFLKLSQIHPAKKPIPNPRNIREIL